MSEICAEEQSYWDNVRLSAACADILGLEVIQALVQERTFVRQIIQMAAIHFFCYPDELGVRRHHNRIRTLSKLLIETGKIEQKW